MATFATSTINNSQSAIDTIQEQIAELQKRLTETQASHQQILGAEQKGLSAIEQYKEAIAAIAALDEPEMLSTFLNEMGRITQDALGERAIANLLGTPASKEVDTHQPQASPPSEYLSQSGNAESDESDGGDTEVEPAIEQEQLDPSEAQIEVEPKRLEPQPQRQPSPQPSDGDEPERKLSNHPWKSDTDLAQSDNDGTDEAEPEQVEPKPEQLELLESKPESNNSKPEPQQPASYKAIPWDGMRNFCKSHKLKTGGKTRKQVEAKLKAAGYAPADISQWLSAA